MYRWSRLARGKEKDEEKRKKELRKESCKEGTVKRKKKKKKRHWKKEIVDTNKACIGKKSPGRKEQIRK